jgi:hypothetical protein
MLSRDFTMMAERLQEEMARADLDLGETKRLLRMGLM